MTMSDLSRRTEKANGLKVYRVDTTTHYVESQDGKICYRVSKVDGCPTCTCGDYANGSEKDPSFVCKHILAAHQANGNAQYLAPATTGSSTLDERFIIRIKGKEFVLYTGLLDLAHQKGVRKILVEPVQLPVKENRMEAICKATVEATNGELYVEYADANPANVSKMVVEHLLRVAATRAKARALRDFTNIGMTCLEELGNLDDPSGEESDRSRPRASREPRKEAEPSPIPVPAGPQTGATDERQPERPHERPPETPTRNQTSPPVRGNSSPPQRPKDPAVADTPAGQGLKPSEAQLKAIEKLAERRGIKQAQMTRLFEDKFHKAYPAITSDDAKTFIKQLQAA